MTKLGIYLAKKSVNKSEVARKTGLSNPRLSELTINPRAKLRADELYLIALAIGSDPSELLNFVCSDVKLKPQEH
jgi:putative transcriptional regulator